MCPRFPVRESVATLLFAAVSAWSSGATCAESTSQRLPPADSFHPARRPGPDGALPPMPAPTWGGTLTIHTENLPRHLNLALSSSAYARRILSNTHAWLQGYDPRTLRIVPEIAERVDVEDMLKSATGERIGHIDDGGDAWIVHADSGDERVPKSSGVSVARGVVFTFHLGAGWTWHDGHPFDADDVVFSWSIYHNPDVKCDERRWQHLKIERAEKLDARTVRFVYAEQYFHAAITIGDLFLLPRHLYDPTDPDHVRHAPEFHAARLARDPSWKPGPKDIADCVNDNPHNRIFVGLGPYEVKSWIDDVLEVERASTWRDDARAGHFDRIRWRRVPDFAAAFRALSAGELDFDDAVTTDDYFGSVAESPEFRAKYYTGTHGSQSYWFIGWNTLSPKLTDPRVRRALAHLADLESYRTGYYRGLAHAMNGPFLPNSPARDATIEPLAHDVKRAEALLVEAGWIDRDGDGIRDKDGVALEIELLVEAQNTPALGFAAKFQEDLARGGVRLKVQGLDFATLDERKSKRRFEAVQLGWAMAPEADPEQMWHSRWAAADKTGGNFVGLADPEVDALIEAGQRELEFAPRQAIWHRLQARLMDLQPYLFCFAPLRKFAMLRGVRGFQETLTDPNWEARDLYFAPGTPGTRASLR
jgi:peptide/nickel transport system substrate-binding protein